MNNDWRNDDMSYRYRAQQRDYDAQFAAQQREAYAEGAQQSRRGYDASSSYAGYAGGDPSSAQSRQASYGYDRVHDARDRYRSGDYTRPSYGTQSYGAPSYNAQGYGARHAAPQREASYRDYRQDAYTASSRQEPYGAQGYSAPSYGSDAGTYSRQDAYRDYAAQPSQDTYYRPAYTRPSYGQTQGYAYTSSYSRTSYQPPMQQEAPGRMNYAPQQPVFDEPDRSTSAYAQTPAHAAPERPAQAPAEDKFDELSDLQDVQPSQDKPSADTRSARPVAPLEKKNQLAAQPGRPASRPSANAQTGELSQDMQSRLERMRQAGEAALRAQGYQEEDASAFMNTGMINLDAVIGSMGESDVDPVISAQQTARMAVIRQAQLDAPLQQPENPGQRSQHSRPGYSAKKEDGTHEEQRKKSIWRNVVEWVLLLVLAVGAAFLLRTYVLSFYLVQGSSMEPTFYTGQRLLVNKIGYTIGDIERFDTVVCHYPGSENYYVKRVIGLPGDTVSIDEGTVYVNGQALEETYVVNADDTGMQEMIVEEGCYLVFGDNRVDSLDSRSIGAIEEDAIVGRVIAVTWPISDFTTVKRLEDNVPSADAYDANAQNGIADMDDLGQQEPVAEEELTEEDLNVPAAEGEGPLDDQNTVQ